MLGNDFEGPQSPQRPNPPLAHHFSKVKEIDSFTTSLFLKQVWGQKQIIGDYNKQLADLLISPYREVSQKLGGLDVSSSGSRAHMSVLEPLVSNATRIHFHFHP